MRIDEIETAIISNIPKSTKPDNKHNRNYKYIDPELKEFIISELFVGKQIGDFEIIDCFRAKDGHYVFIGQSNNFKKHFLLTEVRKQAPNVFKNIHGEDYTRADKFTLDTALNKVIMRYKNNASKSKREWKLTNEEAKNLMTSNCYYCGKEPSNIIKRANKIDVHYYTGIDRQIMTKITQLIT